MNFILSTLARVLIVLPAFFIGLGHFTNTEGMSHIVPPWLPAPTFWVYLTGVFLIAATVGIVFRIRDRQAGMLLAVLIASFAFTIHLPHALAAVDPNNPGAAMMKMTSHVLFLKDLGLAGGALLIGLTSKASKA